MSKDKYAYNQCKCGGRKYYRAKTCNKCRFRQMRKDRRERTLKDVFMPGASRTKWAQVRRDALDKGLIEIKAPVV